jgi:hypothetical protein
MQITYTDIPSNQIDKQKKYFYGSIVDLLYKREEGYPLLDARIQTLINQIMGSNKLFGEQAEVLSIVAFLETARKEPSQFRKCVLDAANLVDTLRGGDSNV